MTSGDDVRNDLAFKTSEDGLISYQISDNANGDSWKNIYVIYNARTETVDYPLEGNWKVAVYGDEFDINVFVKGPIKIPANSMAVLYQE